MRRIEDDEYFFINYENIIRNPSAYIIYQLVNDENYSAYKDFIDIEKLKDLSINQIIKSSTNWIVKNPLEYFAKNKFDYDLSYAELYLSMDNVIKDSPLLKFGNALNIILSQQFTKKVYIYSKEYDSRIDSDIRKQFNANRKISYINGGLIEAIKNISNITTFVLDDIEMVRELINNNLIEYKTVLLANYGYNYKLSDLIIDKKYGKEIVLKIDNIDNLMQEKIFKLKMFIPNSDT